MFVKQVFLGLACLGLLSACGTAEPIKTSMLQATKLVRDVPKTKLACALEVKSSQDQRLEENYQGVLYHVPIYVDDMDAWIEKRLGEHFNPADGKRTIPVKLRLLKSTQFAARGSWVSRISLEVDYWLSDQNFEVRQYFGRNVDATGMIDNIQTQLQMEKTLANIIDEMEKDVVSFCPEAAAS